MPKKPVARGFKRSYLYKVDARCNAAKLAALEAVHREWARLLPVVGQHLWLGFLNGNESPKSLSSAVGADSVFGATPLVTSVKQCMAVAAEGLIQSWKSNLANRLARQVMRSERWAREEPRRHQLLWLNRRGLWLVPFDAQAQRWAAFKPEAAPLDAQASRLLRRYVRLYLRRFRGPLFENLPLQVNQLSSVLALQTDARLDGVTHWLRLSTLVRGARIELPLRGNRYAQQFQGPHALTFSLFKRQGRWYVKVVKTLALPEPQVGPVLGMDFGMTNLLALSNGALFERAFNLRLKRWDEALLRLTRGLQGAGERQLRECRRYRSFIQRFKGWLTSQVKGAVNRALERFKPGTVVMEDLGFHAQAGELSARMNRLVRRMGTGIFKEALEQKSPAQGFKLEKVNPAYTSQECRSCGFIARDSRRGNHYRCACCKRQGHADALASANLVERFRQGRSALTSKHTALGVQGLQRWAQQMLRLLEQATPGTSRHQGALGCARAGLAYLQKKNSGALRRCESLQVLQALLNRISADNRSTGLNGLSTRYSG